MSKQHKLDHPCKDTCSGWAAGAESRDKVIKELRKEAYKILEAIDSNVELCAHIFEAADSLREALAKIDAFVGQENK